MNICIQTFDFFLLHKYHMTDKAGAIKSILKPNKNKIKLLVFTNKNTLYKVAYTVKPALHNTLLIQYTLYPAIIKLQTILSL